MIDDRLLKVPTLKRYKTKYPGVTYIMGTAVSSGKPERIYYIRYRKNGKEIEEKAGRQIQDDMTPARAALVRASKIDGKVPSNKEQREDEEKQKLAEFDRWTIARLWDEYTATKIGLKGIVTDRNRFVNHIKPKFGEMEPSALTPLDIDKLKQNLLKAKSPGTVKNILELLRRIVNFGIAKKLCDGPEFRIQLPSKVNNQRTEDLTTEQMKALLKAIDDDPHHQAGTIMKLALYTGMRRGEMFKLKWEHIDFERGFILIIDPKGGPDQKIPLNDAARQLLDKRPNKTHSPYVFPGRKGKQRTDINKAVNKIKKAAGLPKDFRPLHGLRHVYASMLASSGQVDMYTLQKLLTHKDPKMTQRYAHLRDETLKKASNLAGDIIYEIGRTKK